MIIGLILFSQIAQKISELEAALQKKDEDMKAMEERYKMYLEKARNVSDPPAKQILCAHVLVIPGSDTGLCLSLVPVLLHLSGFYHLLCESCTRGLT